MEATDQLVRVLYNFEYSKDGRNVWMKEGESLKLLKKTNPDWWQVIRTNERKPFYVPAAYVEEVSSGKAGSKHGSNNSVKGDCEKSSLTRRDKLADKNLFKEFPVSDPKENRKCSDIGEETNSDHFKDDECEIVHEKIREPEELDNESKKLLHDKRKSWAAEELVTELTQMAIARSEPVESDYVNLSVDGDRFVIAPPDEEEMGVPTPLFWQSSGFGKETRNNPMSSSDELDNSDSLGQSNCVAWQSKYSLSSEGDKTDESIQSFHSLGNESVSSRHWRDDQGSPDSSPYAQVICAGSTSSTSIETSGLKLSESLERLAQQIKFPCEENDAVHGFEPIAPPREYEAPVYENIDVQTKHTKSESVHSSSSSPEPAGEEMLKSLRDRLLLASCISERGELEEPTVISDEEEDNGCDSEEEEEVQHQQELRQVVQQELRQVVQQQQQQPQVVQQQPQIVQQEPRQVVQQQQPQVVQQQPQIVQQEPRQVVVPRRVVAECVRKVSDPASGGAQPAQPAQPELKIEGCVDVKKKIALWNSSVESQDLFDEDSRPRKVSASPKFRAFRGVGLGVVKSASESKVAALVNRHGGLPGSRSGSEEFLEVSPGSEDGVVPPAAGAAARRRFGGSGSPQLNPEGDNLDASDSGVSNKSDEAALGSKRRRPSLVRNRRVESCRRYQRLAAPPPGAPPGVPRPQSPPPPSPGQEAARLLPGGWAEFRTADGRSFYYHAASGQRRWKPPRRRTRQDSGRSASSSPLQGEDGDQEQDCDGEGPLPRGWRAVMDQSGQLCYVHQHQHAKWFSSSDNKGRVYFFEENSNESSWNLPEVNSSLQEEPTVDSVNQTASYATREDDGGKPVYTEKVEKPEKLSLRTTKSRSMVIVDAGLSKDSKNIPLSRNWPQLFDGDMCVLKEGPMYRTKITENGKKLRKNWVSSHVVLTELFLLLFRDAKSFAALKSSSHGSSASRPELCVDLNGALIDQVDRGDKASVTSRKNVFLVSTVLGLQVLFQCDCNLQAEEWFNAVHTAIHNLPSGFDNCPRIKVTKETDRLFAESNSPEQTKKFPRISRSKSVKIKNKDGSIEDLTVSVAERQTKIRARLKKFFNRRPTMESLVKKGIWKDEPAFGCFLEQVCASESPRVPLFVQRCIAVIESSEDNMKTDGLYRASGNLSQVQKIRLQVDQNNLSALDHEEDVHVLTGALKLFFRELKEPLIPYTAFSKAIKASTIQNKKEKLSQFREIVKSLSTANHDTLKVLLKHLLKVTSFQEFNRMHIPNLAIVFGPTLMWPEQESLNMALDLMQQNLVIEAFLLDFDSIFR